jgi:hypothetical protein
MSKGLILSVFTLALLTFVINVNAINPYNLTFNSQNYSTNYRFNSIASDGTNFYLVGNNTSSNIIQKVDSDGTSLWTETNLATMPDGSMLVYSDITYDSYSGRIFITGYGVTTKKANLLAIDPSGNLLFNVSILDSEISVENGTYTNPSNPLRVLTNSTGSVFVQYRQPTGGTEKARIGIFRNSDGYNLKSYVDCGTNGGSNLFRDMVYNPITNSIYCVFKGHTSGSDWNYYYTEFSSSLTVIRNIQLATGSQNFDVGQLVLGANNEFYLVGSIKSGGFWVEQIYRLNITGSLMNGTTYNYAGGDVWTTSGYYDTATSKLFTMGYLHINSTHVNMPFLREYNQDLPSANWDLWQYNITKSVMFNKLIFDNYSFYSGGYTNDSVISSSFFNWKFATSIPPLTSAVIGAAPSSGSYSQLYTFNMNMSGGKTPYLIKMYIDNSLLSFFNSSSSTYTITGSGFGVGNHSVFVNVTDNYGETVLSNTAYFYAAGIGQINPVTLTISPISATSFTTFTYNTSKIGGGTPPYIVSIEAFETGPHTLTTCVTAENGTCSGTFSALDLFTSGNILISALINDTAGNTRETTGTMIYLSKANLGNPLVITYSASPINANSETTMTLNASFTGGKAPYKVIFWDTSHLPICTYDNAQATNYILYMYPFAGSHQLGVTVYSSDGQFNLTDPWITSEADQGSNVFRLQNRVLNCGGTLSSDSQNYYNQSTGTGPSGSTAPFTDLGSGINQFITILTSPLTIWTIVLGALGGIVEYNIRTGGKMFGMIMVIGITILAIFGIYPWWFLIIEAVLVAGIIALVVKKGT